MTRVVRLGLIFAMAALAVAFTWPAAGSPVAAAAVRPATVINGCTIVANPSPTNFSKCRGANLSGADLVGVNLSYADLYGVNLTGAQLALCTIILPPNFAIDCGSAEFEHTNLTHAALTGATASSCVSLQTTPTLTSVNCAGVDLTDANLRHAVLTNLDLSSANLTGAALNRAVLGNNVYSVCYPIGDGFSECPGTRFTDAVMPRANLSDANLATTDFTGADLDGASLSGDQFGATFPEPEGNFTTSFANANLTNANFLNSEIQGANLAEATLTGANFTGTTLAPGDQAASASTSHGTTVTWPPATAQTGATPGTCTRASGSNFRVGVTTVHCTVVDSFGNLGKGLFTVTVTGP